MSRSPFRRVELLEKISILESKLRRELRFKNALVHKFLLIDMSDASLDELSRTLEVIERLRIEISIARIIADVE